MFRYYMRTRLRDFLGWFCIALATFLWIWYTRSLFAFVDIRHARWEAINNLFGTNFQTNYEAISMMPEVTIRYYFEGAIPLMAQYSFLSLIFACPLLARTLNSPQNQLPLLYGCNRTRYVLFLSGMFYLTVILLLGLLLLVHMARIIFYSCLPYSRKSIPFALGKVLPLVDWGRLLRVWLRLAAYTCQLCSLAVLAAFLSQKMSVTAAAAIALAATLATIARDYPYMLPYVQLGHYFDTAFWASSVTTTTHVAVAARSLLWVAVTTAFSCFVYRRTFECKR